jgi:hypothetical protein
VGIERINLYGDIYEAGTERERVYLRVFVDVAGGPRLEDNLKVFLDLNTSGLVEISILYDEDTTITELEEFNNDKADILIERQIFDNIEEYN